MKSRRRVNSTVMLLHSMNAMRILLIASILLLLPAVAHGQDEEGRITPPITRAQILALPRRNAAPTLTLQRALKIAERFTRKRRIDISSAYLFEAKWITDSARPETGAWHFWWVSTNHWKPDIRIAVSVDGKPKLLPLPGST